MEKQSFPLGEGATKLWFKAGTPAGVADAIHWAYTNRSPNGRIRVRVWYGDPETGRAWLEEADTIGHIGRSTGTIKVPLLVHNRRSLGGGALLTSHIVKIAVARKGHRVLYEHPSFSTGHFVAGPPHGFGIAPPAENLPTEYTCSVWHYHSSKDEQWTNVANFRTSAQAQRYIDFMVGRRFTK